MSNTESSRALTRDDLKAVLRANVDAFMLEPDFYEYLTELIIYLMQYEFAWPEGEAREKMLAAAVEQRGLRLEFVQQLNLASRTVMPTATGRCRVCGGELRDRAICPHCMANNR